VHVEAYGWWGGWMVIFDNIIHYIGLGWLRGFCSVL
jgi:hypothetical protein